MVKPARPIKKKRQFSCRACGAPAPTWTGRCSVCQAWASIEEVTPSRPSITVADLQPLSAHQGVHSIPLPTGLPEVDRVLGGGIVPGSVILLSGEPGVGKSTLTLQIAVSVAASGASVVLVTGEEAPTQVAARASRLGPVPVSLAVLDCTSTEAVQSMMALAQPQLVIVDSVQTLRLETVESAAGSVSQVRESAAALVAEAKRSGVSVLLVGHVTKDGSVAGPRLLEHVVDTVLTFTGDRSSGLRFLRSVKHRFGSTTETGVFEMAADGLRPVLDLSRRLLQDRAVGASGSVVVPLLEGHRPVLVELQALTTRRGEQGAQLSVQGIQASRARLVLAVLDQRAGQSVQALDAFVSLVGGGSSDDPGLDLALALAIWSSASESVLGDDLVASAEIGLAGELRSPTQIERRLHEAYRLGFRRAVVPRSVRSGPTGLRLLHCSTLSEAIEALRPVLAG